MVGTAEFEGVEDVIRSAAVTDAEGILAIYRDFVTETGVTFETEPPSLDEMRARIERAVKRYAWLVFERAAELLGYAYADRFHPRPAYRWSVEVSVYVKPDFQGQGVGRSLLSALLESLGGRGYVNAFAGVALPNPASVKLFESLGFEQIALQKQVGYKLGRWRDVGWWQLELAAASVPPPIIEWLEA
jgi:L-amino acid N-acyltransferase YncA